LSYLFLIGCSVGFCWSLSVEFFVEVLFSSSAFGGAAVESGVHGAFCECFLQALDGQLFGRGAELPAIESSERIRYVGLVYVEYVLFCPARLEVVSEIHFEVPMMVFFFF